MKAHRPAQHTTGRPRSLPPGWRWVKLGDVLTYQKEFITIEDDVQYQLVTVKLHGKGVVPRDKLKGAAIKSKSQQIVRAGQLLVAEIDAKVGGFGIVPKELDGAIVSGHYFLYRIDTSKVLPEFLEGFIISGVLTEQIQQYVQGSTNYAAIRAYDLLDVWIPVPPLDQQRMIVHQLQQAKIIQDAAERQL